MNKIYLEISQLTEFFRQMCYGLTKDDTEVEDAVQELMLYFMQMNKETLQKIYDNDGLLGIKRYGAVVLRRSITSVRSPYYYKYKKYYDHISRVELYSCKKNPIENIPEEIVENIKFKKLDKIDVTVGDNCTWYDKKVFELYYYDGNTLDSLAEKTGISRNSLFTTIDKVRKIIKDNIDV